MGAIQCRYESALEHAGVWVFVLTFVWIESNNSLAAAWRPAEAREAAWHTTAHKAINEAESTLKTLGATKSQIFNIMPNFESFLC